MALNSTFRFKGNQIWSKKLFPEHIEPVSRGREKIVLSLKEKISGHYVLFRKNNTYSKIIKMIQPKVLLNITPNCIFSYYFISMCPFSQNLNKGNVGRLKFQFIKWDSSDFSDQKMSMGELLC
ncbi:MAG: hypothetical protein QXD43_05605 [Candidatus Aenigmatarchaeota archaeon]